MTLSFSDAVGTDRETLRQLDEGHRFGWDALSIAHPPIDNVPPDVWRTRLWILLHHAAFVTYPHHDANGLTTYILPEDGWKFWGILEPKNITGMESREQLTELFDQSLFPERPAENDQDEATSKMNMTPPKQKEDEEDKSPPTYQEKTDMYIIYAKPGDLM